MTINVELSLFRRVLLPSISPFAVSPSPSISFNPPQKYSMNYLPKKNKKICVNQLVLLAVAVAGVKDQGFQPIQQKEMATPIQGFPAKSLKASATVGSSLFDVITVGFSDKIAVNVNVNGKISSMVSEFG